jgi:hypothetical protein
MLSATRALAAAMLLLVGSALADEPVPSPKGSRAMPPGAVLLDVPGWISVPITRNLYWWWRKYGPWDYKVQATKFKPFTLYNFGATGAAAGLPQNALEALAGEAGPTTNDLAPLDQPNLAEQFEVNAEALETLRKMAEADADLSRIARDFTWLTDKSNWPRDDVGITPARWAEYRALFDKVHLQDGVVRTEDFPDAIFFVSKAKGLCVAGSSAGYVYSARALSPLTRSPASALDAEARRRANEGFAYVFRHLKENWYAFYEIDW